MSKNPIKNAVKTCIVCNKEVEKYPSIKKKQCKSCYNKEYKRNNKERINEQNKKRYNSDPVLREKVNKRAKNYYKVNKEKITTYRQDNKENRAEYHRQRYNSDPLYKLTSNLRSRFYNAINGLVKYESVLNLIGCTLEELKAHLGSQFTEGMSWENHGEWHIDHIRPCASFDLTDQEQQKQCFHYTNLQPLWAKDNLSKGAKYED